MQLRSERKNNQNAIGVGKNSLRNMEKLQADKPVEIKYNDGDCVLVFVVTRKFLVFTQQHLF